MPMPRHASITLTVNGEPVDAAFAPYKTLLEVLREDLNLCGTKHGCELGECSTCGVLVDGKPFLSCLALPLDLEDRAITTIEGMAEGGRPHPLQVAFAELGAAQCGYCTPAMLLTARALLGRDASPSREAIRQALSGVLCRCFVHTRMFRAIRKYAESRTA